MIQIFSASPKHYNVFTVIDWSNICSDLQKVTAAAGCVYLAGRIAFAYGYYTGG